MRSATRSTIPRFCQVLSLFHEEAVELHARTASADFSFSAGRASRTRVASPESPGRRKAIGRSWRQLGWPERRTLLTKRSPPMREEALQMPRSTSRISTTEELVVQGTKGRTKRRHTDEKEQQRGKQTRRKEASS
ncbi:hypothetical protein K0M31_013301, partial [Melipona bicolor]